MEVIDRLRLSLVVMGEVTRGLSLALMGGRAGLVIGGLGVVAAVDMSVFVCVFLWFMVRVRVRVRK